MPEWSNGVEFTYLSSRPTGLVSTQVRTLSPAFNMNKLIVFDMDGVIFQDFNFWIELHKAFGTYEEGLALTQKYLKTDYQKLVDEVIGRLWKGKPTKIYFNLIKKAEYVKGAQETLKELKNRGYKIGIISSGPWHLAERAKQENNLDYHITNKLPIKNGKILGSKNISNWTIQDGKKKDPLKEIAKINNSKVEDTIVIVHEHNDIEMAEESKLAIAFNPTSKELEKHCEIIVKGNNLKEILKYIP